MKTQVGFTLVEIAIVMVILGLLLGGILKGHELIINAKIKKLESEYQEITTAVYSYQYRYHALPGDDKYATRRFKIPSPSSPDVPAIMNGDGNGSIRGNFDDASDHPDRTQESRHVWAHLRLAGLVAGEPGSTILPVHSFGGMIGVSSQQFSVEERNPVTINGLFVGFTNIPNRVAIILESRGDDTQPHTGNIQTEEFDYNNSSTIHKMYLAF